MHRRPSVYSDPGHGWVLAAVVAACLLVWLVLTLLGGRAG